MRKLKFENVKFSAEEAAKLKEKLKNPAVKFSTVKDENGKPIFDAESQEPRLVETEIVREVREYELITPLFGGGAETKKADEVSIVRATEIRGHLRFWWRAVRGGQFDSIEKMKRFEDAIFGSTDKHSKIHISFELENNYDKRKRENEAKLEPAFELKKTGEKLESTTHESVKDLQYVAFPLQATEKERKDLRSDQTKRSWKSEVSVGVKFKTIFFYPKEIKIENEKIDVHLHLCAALWAWENFGGIGGRTRRGFGALILRNHQINGQTKTIELFETEEAFKAKAQLLIHGGKAPKGVPYLKNLRLGFLSKKQIGSDLNAIGIWKELIGAYKSFRQQREKTARSKWNEPEAIRNLINQRLITKDERGSIIAEESHEPIKPDFEKFPRAAFGLPINFKFHRDDTWEKDKRRKIKPDDGNVDPRKTLLRVSDLRVSDSEIKKRERFSSPLILRPIEMKNGNAIGIALILENETKLDDLDLTLESQEGKNWSKSGLKSILTSLEAKQIEAASKKTTQRLGSKHLLGNETDVLQAFLNYLEK